MPKDVGRVAVITGASDGIGREIALHYAKRKYKLVLAGRSQEKLFEVQDLCTKQGSLKCCVYPLDVAKQDDCRKLIQLAVQQFEKIDILVLCAAISYHNLFEFSNMQAFRHMMDVNYFGYAYTTYYALPLLKASQGQIIVLSSVSGELGLPLRTGYCASKFAVNGFFEALRLEVPEISITLAMPSSVNTNMRNKSEFGEVQVAFNEDESKRVPLEECVRIIMDAADNRTQKVIFPFSNKLAILLRPFFPNLVARIVKKKAGGEVHQNHAKL